MISKGATFVISAIVSLPILLIGSVGTYTLCSSNESCVDYLHMFFLQSLPFFGVFVVSILLYFVRDEIYESWFRFARWWIPLSMLLIFISPEYPTGIYDPIQKGSVAFGMSAAFIVISILIIIMKYFALKRRG